MICVLVDVTYDYYRFQENIFAGTFEACLEEANRLNSEAVKRFGIRKERPIIKNKEESKLLRDIDHYWIQKVK